MGEATKKTLSWALAIAAVAAGAAACSVSAEVGAGGGDGEDGADPAAAAKAGTDGVQSGDETDVDCGGSAPKRCAVGQKCKIGGDCESGSCKSGICAAPAPDDGVKNGDETDVDCGGAKAPKCADGKGCAADSDCANDTCSYKKKCVSSPSCKNNHGGDTCGENGKDDCCASVSITDGSSPFSIDKYQATAGRMRAFIDKTNGNLQAWVAQANPKGWNDGWTDQLPSSMDEALFLLGPGNKRGCNVTAEGGRTYAQGPIDGNADEKSDFSQDVLDEKALNCVTWFMAQALCAFDGKRLAKTSEIRHIFKNGGTTTYPWQFQDQSGFNPNAPDDRLVHRYNYETPNVPAGLRLVNNEYPLDHAFYIAPPGRFPKGADKYGVEDAAGNLLPWVDDAPKQFVWTFSWENHKGDVTTQTWNPGDAPDGYYAIGFRCAAD